MVTMGTVAGTLALIAGVAWVVKFIWTENHLD